MAKIAEPPLPVEAITAQPFTSLCRARVAWACHIAETRRRTGWRCAPSVLEATAQHAMETPPALVRVRSHGKLRPEPTNSAASVNFDLGALKFIFSVLLLNSTHTLSFDDAFVNSGNIHRAGENTLGTPFV
jgi:hypothetical protein